MVCIKLQSRKSIWIITSVPISDIWDVHLIHMMIVTSLPVLIVVMELLFLGVNQKWGDFFAFGGAWRLSSEKFMSSISYLDDLKLKLSWGKNGNQGLDP